MLQIQSLKELRATKADAVRSLIEKATTEKRDLSDQEQAAFDTLKGEIKKAERDLANAEFVAELERRSTEATPVGGDQRYEDELRKFSLQKALLLGMPGHTVDCGRERELSAEIARRAGRQFEGVAVPWQVFEQRVLTTAGTGGPPATGVAGSLIATDYLGGQFIDVLRSQLIVRRAGARVLTNLIGNVSIPKLKSSAVTGWVAENAGLTPSDQEYDSVQLTPKHVGAIVEFSRNLLLQTASPDIETLIRNDFAQLISRSVDKGAIIGGGSNEPVGVVANSSVDDSVSFATPAWDKVLDLVGMVQDADAEGASAAFVTSGAAVRKLRSTVRVSSTDSRMIMEDRNTLAGYPCMTTSQIPVGASPATTTIVFGTWSDLLLGIWSELDILTNPYSETPFSKGNVVVRAMATVDVNLRHTESFAYSDDFAA